MPEAVPSQQTGYIPFRIKLNAVIALMLRERQY